MRTHTQEPRAAKAHRFFALTLERLEAIQRHRLTRAEILVWAHVELHARPRCPVAFTLEGIAEHLQLAPISVRRAVRRLLEVRLLLGIFEGNRYRLAPAAGAFDQAEETRSPLITSPPREASEGGSQVIPPSTSAHPATRSPLIEGQAAEAGQKPAAGLPHGGLSTEKEKLSLSPLGEALVRDWGMYPAVAERLVLAHGEDRVRQVLAWGESLKRAGKLKSRGWCFQALERGWSVPSRFNPTRQDAQEGPSSKGQVSQDPPQATEAPEPLDEAAKVETLRAMYAKPMPALKRLALKLATDWGVSLEAAGIG